MSSEKSIRDKVRNWLLEDDFTIEEQAEEGLAWFFAAIGGDKGFGISQRLGKPDEVYIKLKVEFDGDMQKALAKMTASKREAFYSEVRFSLLVFDVEFQPHGEPIWEFIVISNRIFEDALTKDELLRRIFLVNKAGLAVSWISYDHIPNPAVIPQKGTGRIH